MNWKLAGKIWDIVTCLILSTAAIVIMVKVLSVNQRLQRLEQKDIELRSEITRLGAADSWHDQNISTLISADSMISTRLFGTEARVDVLDTSIHPDKKRQQRLLLTRDSILATLHNGRSIRACGELNPWDVYRMAGWYVDYTDRYGVDLNLALAVGQRESLFCQKAVSRAGAVGVMQLMDGTASDLAQRIGLRLSRHKTQDNIRMGVYYLGQLLLDFKGDTELAVKAYNTGPHNVKKVLAGELSDYYSETKEYWEFVQQYQQDFKEEGL